MRAVLLALALAGAAAGLGAAWYFGFNLGGDVRREVPPPLVALHEHFARNGIATRVGLVRIQIAGVQARAFFELKDGSGGSFFVMWFGSAASAVRQAAEFNSSSRPTVAATNHGLLLQMIDWPRDGEATRRIVAAFMTFDASVADAPPDGPASRP